MRRVAARGRCRVLRRPPPRLEPIRRRALRAVARNLCVEGPSRRENHSVRAGCRPRAGCDDPRLPRGEPDSVTARPECRSRSGGLADHGRDRHAPEGRRLAVPATCLAVLGVILGVIPMITSLTLWQMVAEHSYGHSRNGVEPVRLLRHSFPPRPQTAPPADRLAEKPAIPGPCGSRDFCIDGGKNRPTAARCGYPGIRSVPLRQRSGAVRRLLHRHAQSRVRAGCRTAGRATGVSAGGSTRPSRATPALRSRSTRRAARPRAARPSTG